MCLCERRGKQLEIEREREREREGGWGGRGETTREVERGKGRERERERGGKERERETDSGLQLMHALEHIHTAVIIALPVCGDIDGLWAVFFVGMHTINTMECHCK